MPQFNLHPASAGSNPACWKFPLPNLPSNANVTKVRLRYTIVPGGGGGAAGLWNFVPYCGAGQDDPGPADCESFYNCCFGVAYVSSTNPRNPGTYWETLGDGENAQACIDVENAKSAVNRFSVGCSEQNQDDPHCQFYGRPVNQSAVLEITYELPPAVGYSYSDGLVSVSVLTIMRKAILAVCRRVAG